MELLGRHAGRVVVSDPLRNRAIAEAKRKTDDIDAATLAELLAADYPPEVWVPDETTRSLRRRTALSTDPFGVAGPTPLAGRARAATR